MRRSFKIVVFYLFLTSGANLLAAAGITKAMGVEAPVGVSGTRGEVEQASKQLAGADTGDSLFGLVTGVADTFGTITKAAFALPDLLGAIGIPGPLVGFLFAPLVVVVAYDAAHLLTGRFA